MTSKREINQKSACNQQSGNSGIEGESVSAGNNIIISGALAKIFCYYIIITKYGIRRGDDVAVKGVAVGRNVAGAMVIGDGVENRGGINLIDKIVVMKEGVKSATTPRPATFIPSLPATCYTTCLLRRARTPPAYRTLRHTPISSLRRRAASPAFTAHTASARARHKHYATLLTANALRRTTLLH